MRNEGSSFIDSFRRYQQFDNWFLAFNPLSKLNILFVRSEERRVGKEC